MSGAVLKYDAACRAIAEAKSFDEVKEWADKAAAVREYSRRIGNRQLEIDAIEIRVRARRRRGELLMQLRDEGKLREGKPSTVTEGLTLADLGISYDASSEEQKIAKIAPDAFERLVARCRAYAEEHPEKHAFNVLKPPPEGGAVNGARAIMGSRLEPDDSLDYFPTPPWASRALIEHVLPQVEFFRGDIRKQGAWEPACGEGHIAEVLREYFADVAASDIHDYGYGDGHDFLCDQVQFCRTDWIITNPPFGEKTEAFVLRAIDDARIGVAMFVRLQWLETIGRYERLFKDRPPTLIAFFTERVNLCKGRWDPDGGTATAYIWLVWVKGASPRAPFWIPPGRREALTRPDDVERFTAQPVTRKEHPRDAAGAPLAHDEATGEIDDTDSNLPPCSIPGAAGGAAARSEGSTNPAAVTFSGEASRTEHPAGARLDDASQPEHANAHGCTASDAAPAAAAAGATLSRDERFVDADGMVRLSPDHVVAADFVTDDEWAALKASPQPLDIPDFLRRDATNVSPIMRVGGPR